jgi:hypothetical protein
VNVFGKWKRQLGSTAKESGFFKKGQHYDAKKMYCNWAELFYYAKIVHVWAHDSQKTNIIINSQLYHD